jgi:hypothetical protein
MRPKKDAFDLMVEQQLREEDRAKKDAADAELAARMDQHAARGRRRMIDLALRKNPSYKLGLDRHHFSKAEVLENCDCLPHEWQTLTDAFDRMEDIGLGNDGRHWWLGPPEDKATRRGHLLRVGKGVFKRAKDKAETDDAAGHSAAVRKALASNKTDLDNLRRLPPALDALGAPLSADVAQRLLNPPGPETDS